MSETPSLPVRVIEHAHGADPDDDRITLHDSRRERGTRWLFGRPYHWGTDDAGSLRLLAGPDPREIVR
jgi:hypothetical protein